MYRFDSPYMRWEPEGLRKIFLQRGNHDPHVVFHLISSLSQDGSVCDITMELVDMPVSKPEISVLLRYIDENRIAEAFDTDKAVFTDIKPGNVVLIVLLLSLPEGVREGDDIDFSPYIVAEATFNLEIEVLVNPLFQSEYRN